MKKLTILLALGLFASGATHQVQAISITGNLDMTGGVTLNNQFLGSATAATAFNNVLSTGGSTGTFASVPGGVPVTWKPFAWSPASTPITDLWKITHAGVTYSFDLLNISVFFQSNNFLNLEGTGVLRATGYDDTPGQWSFTVSNPGGGRHSNLRFGFANSNSYIPTPEGGSGIAMLGMGLLGLGALRKKFSVKS